MMSNEITLFISNITINSQMLTQIRVDERGASHFGKSPRINQNQRGSGKYVVKAQVY